MSIYPTPRPTRTGIDALRRLAQTACTLLARYNTIIKAILPADRHVYVDALNQACQDFLENVPDPGKPNRPS